VVEVSAGTVPSQLDPDGTLTFPDARCYESGGRFRVLFEEPAPVKPQVTGRHLGWPLGHLPALRPLSPFSAPPRPYWFLYQGTPGASLG
jgi:hypothetical protein